MKISEEEQRSIKNRAAKPMLWLAMIAMSMLFAGLTSAYVVRMGDAGWISFELPKMFFVSTAVIMTSSITMWWATRSAKRDDLTGVNIGTVLTLLLGIAFIVCQFKAYGELVDSNIYLVTKDNNAPQYLYVITAFHLLHLIGGIIMLIYVCIKSFRGFYHSKNLLGLQLSSIYWHFLDVLWIYLFLFLYLTHS